MQIFKIKTIKELKEVVCNLPTEYDDCSVILRDAYGHEEKLNNAVIKEGNFYLNDDLGFDLGLEN